MTRNDARMIAEELAKILRKDIKKMVTEYTSEANEEMIGMDEAAKFTGWSKSTLYKRIGNIPHLKAGRKIRFRKSSLLQYVETSAENRRKPETLTEATL